MAARIINPFAAVAKEGDSMSDLAADMDNDMERMAALGYTLAGFRYREESDGVRMVLHYEIDNEEEGDDGNE
jgi:hypothetical protein